MDSKIEGAFWEFHGDNPHVYEELRKLARGLRKRGHTRLGIGMLFEVLRWRHLMRTTSDADGFKLNNNYRSYYARLLMARERELDGLFQLRVLGAPEPFGQHPDPDAPVGHVS